MGDKMEQITKDGDDDDDEEVNAIIPKTTPVINPYSNADSDFALALALQQQETMFTLESSESESESEGNESHISDDDTFSNYQDFLDSQVSSSGRLGFLEGEDSNSDQDMEEDDIDPDELSYEELIALGEIVGEESKGLTADEISSSLHPSTFHSDAFTTLVDRCVICQVEYKQGEMMVGLPCDHPYHLDCITNWLLIRKVCPICSLEVSSSSKHARLN